MVAMPGLYLLDIIPACLKTDDMCCGIEHGIQLLQFIIIFFFGDNVIVAQPEQAVILFLVTQHFCDLAIFVEQVIFSFSFYFVNKFL